MIRAAVVSGWGVSWPQSGSSVEWLTPWLWPAWWEQGAAATSQPVLGRVFLCWFILLCERSPGLAPGWPRALQQELWKKSESRTENQAAVKPVESGQRRTWPNDRPSTRSRTRCGEILSIGPDPPLAQPLVNRIKCQRRHDLRNERQVQRTPKTLCLKKPVTFWGLPHDF